MSRVSTSGRYARFLGRVVAAMLALLLVGYLPTRRLAGDAATVAMVAGCLVSFVATALAGWLLVATRAETPTARMQRAALAMAVRLAVVVALGLAGALSGVLAPRPLLFWLATTYVVLLPFDVMLAIAQD